MKHFQTKYLNQFLMVLLLFFAWSQSSAQCENCSYSYTKIEREPKFLGSVCIKFALKDPLKVPNVWRKLERNPFNNTLWAEYMGDSLKNLPKEKLECMYCWKMVLMFRYMAENEILVGFALSNEELSAMSRVDDLFFEQIQTDTKEITQASDSTCLQNPIINKENRLYVCSFAAYELLKKDIPKNFLAIEDFYRSVCVALNQNYISYQQAHPDGLYNKITWMAEQEKLLKKIKDNQLKILYYNVAAEP
jgi:hypothetical protein